jgi:hypothetical protein
MSRTYRQIPQDRIGIRHPKQLRDRKQQKKIQTDSLLEEFQISPINRLNRHIADDLKLASSLWQLDYGI